MPDKKSEKKKSMLKRVVAIMGLAPAADNIDPEKRNKKKNSSRANALRQVMDIK